MKSCKSIWIVVSCVILSIFACVTINIYFPAEKVESVAGEIVNDIRGQRGGEGKKVPGSDKDSFLRKTFFALSPSVVWAQDVTEVSNPTIRALKERMKSRFAQLKPSYEKGMLVEKDNGYLSPRNTGGLGLKEKRDLNALVEAENSDRQRLYEEVAKALNIDSSQIARIQTIFAKEWQKPVR
jgi:uncharacterized protein YdbL (DUF1318 family)